MRFVVISKPRNAVPLEMQAALNKAMIAWIDDGTGSGVIEEAWAFAGISGGGGILNVSSLEELDAILLAFPYSNFSETEVFGLTDLQDRLARFKAYFNAIAGG